MPDFHFGYLCARDEHDLGRLLERVERREQERPATPRAGTASIDGDGSHLGAYDYILHFGHGQAWCVEKGLTGQQVGALDLPKAPVVFSGACFNGVLSRSYHPCAYQFVFLKPVTVKPERLMTLNWVHAGVSGYLAALEGDRGEMAMAEWEYFRSRACTLGETIGYQYRLAFVSVYADFTKFPRYRPGYKKRMSHYDVMLRGMVSRLLLSDPSFRPLDKPIDNPVHTIQVAREGDRLQVDVTVERYAQGLHVNYLCQSKRGVFDHRCYVRVELPADLTGSFGESTVAIRNGETPAAVTRHHVRPEVWGGKRYLNLQVEGPMGVLKPGTKVRFVLPITG